MKRTILAAVVASLLIQQGAAGIEAQSPAGPDSLQFFKNYFVTGDYAVAGVGLRGSGVGGLATGNIAISGVPANADVLGAFLYWQTVVAASNLTTASVGATFEGNTIGGVTGVEANGTIATLVNPAGSSPCWSSGGATGGSNGSKTMLVFRADVLRFITTVNAVTGKLAVNSADRISATNPTGGFQVQMPDGGTGNSTPVTSGASLVIVYRDPTMPLKSVVLYDGGFTMDQSTGRFDLLLKGFYQASLSSPNARLTPIVGEGQANFSENVTVNLTPIAGYSLEQGPFTGAAGPDWDNPTFDSANFELPAGASSLALSVNHDGLSSFDCLSWGATVFSTEVQDTDNDGLLDVWEQNVSLVDPKGQPLPNLYAMDARHDRKDIFFEVGYHTTPGYVGGQGTVPAHNHLPSKAALDMVGDAYANAPVSNPDGTTGIRAHIDVGNNYPGDPYVIPFSGGPNNLARGGEAVAELACTPSLPGLVPVVTCDFPLYPGTVGWKSGYQFIRDAVTNPTDLPALHRQRFDANRKDSFRYVLFAHALGLRKSEFACLNDVSAPVPGGVNNACAAPLTPNLNFQTPTKTSGIADPPGADLMVTLGFWDNFKGTDFLQASTWLHEAGHTGGLRHGGAPTVHPITFATTFQPNCRPNFLSVMSYLFQTRGLVCDAASTAPGCAGKSPGTPVVDFSRQSLPALNEGGLSEGTGLGATPSAYRTRWYSPTSFVDLTLGTTTPTKHCDGSPLVDGEAGLFRIDGTGISGAIDWNGDGDTADTLQQDISFSGGDLQALDAGSNDWLNLDLRHIGSRRNVGGLSLGVTAADLGKGDLGKGDLGKGDLGDLGKGDLGKGDLGKGDLGKGDLGKGDLGKGDLGSPNSPDGDLDLDTARHVGNSPNLLLPVVGRQTITLIWTPPHVDAAAVSQYWVWRVIGTTVTQANFAARVLVSGTTVTGTTVVDSNVKNNTFYTYFVQADFTPGVGPLRSGVSNYQTVKK